MGPQEDKYRGAVKGGGINKVAADATKAKLSVDTGFVRGDIAKGASVSYKQEKYKARKDDMAKASAQLDTLEGPPGDAKAAPAEKKAQNDMYDGVKVLQNS